MQEESKIRRYKISIKKNKTAMMNFGIAIATMKATIYKWEEIENISSHAFIRINETEVEKFCDLAKPLYATLMDKRGNKIIYEKYSCE